MLQQIFTMTATVEKLNFGEEEEKEKGCLPLAEITVVLVKCHDLTNGMLHTRNRRFILSSFMHIH